MKNKSIHIRKRITSKFIMMIMMAMLIVVPTLGQEKIQLTMDSKTDITFDGTSNVHDWSCEVEEISGRGAFDQGLFNGGNISEKPVKDVLLTIPIKKIESGKNKMNNIMYDALKSEDYPHIEFELISSKLINETANGMSLQAKGFLTIAGVTRQVELQVMGKKLDNRKIQFTGSKTLNMNNFNIEPPKALFGTIKAGDEVKVKFSAVFTK